MLQLSASPSLLRPQFPSLRHDQPYRHGFSGSATCSGKRLERSTSTDSARLCFEEAKTRIRKLLQDVDISVSSYDTAWVAMVPSPHSSKVPRFPKCIDWLLANQLQDGSWTPPHVHPFLLKDALSSSLAAVLAIKRWGIGEQVVDKGIRFIESNFGSIIDDNQLSPIGFDIIFPGMLEYARDLDLNLQLDSTILDAMLLRRDLELKRCQKNRSQGSEAYLAYISEGILKFQDWDMVMKYQRKNGSLFNSPSTTAAALMHVQNPAFVNYFDSILGKFGSSVPAVYPLDVYAQLSLIDNLERLGICRHFRDDIQSVLEDTYSLWMQGEEEIFKDISACALAFRLLRKHGYDVSSDPLDLLLEEECFSNSFGEHSKDMISLLEVYRAAEMILYQDETTLEKLNQWSKDLMTAKVSAGDSMSVIGKLCKQMDDALKFPCHSTLQRITNRITIEEYDRQNIRILKTSYRSPNFGNDDLLTLAVEDFNRCQLIHLEELKQLERWIVENRLDKLNFARQKSVYCYFSAAATIFAPELSDARMSWAKNGVLTTVVDDFFDVGGSMEEIKNLILLFKRWDVTTTDFCSEKVEIIFSALRSSIIEIGDKAFEYQERNVTGHIIEIWLDLLNSMLREAEWTRDKHIPTMDEYMTNAYVSFALGPIVLPALYLLGHKLSEEAVQHPEYQSLFKKMSTVGRLLNDFQGWERESSAGKLNALSLHMIHSGGGMTEVAAIGHMKRSIEIQKRELLRLVLRSDESVVPRACRDIFWNMIRVVYQFYKKDDGFTSDEIMGVIKSIMFEPLLLPSVTSK